MAQKMFNPDVDLVWYKEREVKELMVGRDKAFRTKWRKQLAALEQKRNSSSIQKTETE